MKKIHFNHLTFKKWTSLLMVLSIVCILIGGFEIFEFEYKRTNRMLASIGYLCQAIYYSKMFWFKNYVEWNKLGMNIKLNSFLSKSITFENVEKLELDNNTLKIIQKSGRNKIFEIDDVPRNDLEKLIAIIQQNSGIEST
ncbi:hypothetical protein [Flavobacterium sandaracinum]|uniref:Uncharacterized protein n=1 Tax=Flavobacterium sandaracinum TaxID=2541733 RepID=A0A4R5DAY9_9FLAO|nr:hypothetical protein [Flavobacterium sandaracinum]TDE07695.1 hypothetical protein E0F91_00995 [Flavobacterium sandaracinum]